MGIGTILQLLLFVKGGTALASADVLRRENKYRVSMLTARALFNKLACVLQQDPHNNGAEGYMVRSLYFDSVDDTDFFEKLDGLESRKKVRLRIYSPNDKFAKLEIKEKQGANQRKRSIDVTRSQAQRMIEGDYSFLANMDSELAHELYALMIEKAYLPKTVVQYNRAAFIVPTNDTRITFDMLLQANESSFDIFSNNFNYYPVASYDDVTLEVKFNHFLLSYVKDLVDGADKAAVAYSKYCIARSVGHYDI